jgi:predicted nucleic acid-binding protein
MTRCYLDTNFLYAHLRTPAKADERVDGWRDRVLASVAEGEGVMSALVIDELAYRLVLAWLRDDGNKDPLAAYRAAPETIMQAMRQRLSATWDALDSLTLELEPTTRGVVERAKQLMADPGLAPRDAFHGAHALHASCTAIASSDDAFDRVPGLERLAP